MREKRQHQRAEFTASVEVVLSTGVLMAQAQDLSLGGMFLRGESLPTVGSEVTLRFELPGFGPVELPGFVRWIKSGGFGIQFGLLGVRETHAIGRFVRNPSPAAAGG